MPARVPAEAAAADLEAMIPQPHRDFVERTLLALGVPPLPDGEPDADGVLGWLHSVARKHVEVALAHPARLIANALGSPPPDVIAAAHERGMLVAALAGTAKHAQAQVASGVDIVVAQGYEAGGHTGEIGSMVLIPEIVDAVGDRVPVLAAGGIGCGRQVAAALALGAAGAWMGSAWLLTHGVRADDVRARGAAGAARGHVLGHRPVAHLQRQARPAAEEPLDGRVGPAGRTGAVAHAAAEPAGGRRAPAAHALRAAGRGADARRADRGPDQRDPPGRRRDRVPRRRDGRDAAAAGRTADEDRGHRRLLGRGAAGGRGGAVRRRRAPRHRPGSGRRRPTAATRGRRWPGTARGPRASSWARRSRSCRRGPRPPWR